jgi:hypothetical protein
MPECMTLQGISLSQTSCPLSTTGPSMPAVRSQSYPMPASLPRQAQAMAGRTSRTKLKRLFRME